MAVVHARIVDGRQRAQRRLDQAVARIDLDRLASPAGRSTSKRVRRRASSQMQLRSPPARSTTFDLDRLADGLALRGARRWRRGAAARPRRDAHGLEAVVHAAARGPATAARTSRGRRRTARRRRAAAASRSTYTLRASVGKRARPDADRAACCRAGAGRGRAIGEAAARRRGSRRDRRRRRSRSTATRAAARTAADRPRARSRSAQQLAEVFDVAGTRRACRRPSGRPPATPAARSRSTRRLVRADGGVRDRREDRARDLQAVVLAQAIEGEDAEDLVGHQDDVAVLPAPARAAAAPRPASAAASRGEAGRVREQRAHWRAGLEHQARDVLAHVGHRLVLAGRRPRAAGAGSVTTWAPTVSVAGRSTSSVTIVGVADVVALDGERPAAVVDDRLAVDHQREPRRQPQADARAPGARRRRRAARPETRRRRRRAGIG